MGPNAIERFEELLLSGDGGAEIFLSEIQKSVKKSEARKSPGKSKLDPLDYDHDMDGLDAAGHTRHIRHHEREFDSIKRQLIHEPEPDRRSKLAECLRKCAVHWNEHRKHKYIPAHKKGEEPVQFDEDGEVVLPKISKSIPDNSCPGCGVYSSDRNGCPSCGDEIEKAVRSIRTISRDVDPAFKQGEIVSYGPFRVRVENPAGSIRKGSGPEGPWESLIHTAYGEIVGTRGMDGDPVDVLLGPDPTAPNAFVVRQHDVGKVLAWGGVTCPRCGNTPEHCKHDMDEDKVILGFHSSSDARNAYLANYGTDAMIGPIDEVPVPKLAESMDDEPGERISKSVEIILKALSSSGSHAIPKPHSLVTLSSDGTKIHVKTPIHHADFHASIKAAIPQSDRQWDMDGRKWIIHGGMTHLAKVSALTHAYFDMGKHPRDPITGKFLSVGAHEQGTHPLAHVAQQAAQVLQDASPDGISIKNEVGWNGNHVADGAFYAYGHHTWEDTEKLIHALKTYKNTQIPHYADALFGEEAKAKMAQHDAIDASFNAMVKKPTQEELEKTLPGELVPKAEKMSAAEAIYKIGGTAHISEIAALMGVDKAFAEKAAKADPNISKHNDKWNHWVLGSKKHAEFDALAAEEAAAASEKAKAESEEAIAQGKFTQAIPLEDFPKTKHYSSTPDELGMALLPPIVKEYMVDLLSIPPKVIFQLPCLSDWEKGFVADQYGKTWTQLSSKQAEFMKKAQVNTKKWCKANPGVLVTLYDIEKAKDIDAKKASEAASAEKQSIIDEQTNTTLEYPPGMNTSMLAGGQLFTHQRAGVNWLMKAKRGILALATGLGKTNTVITAFEKLKHEGKAKRMGFIVPKGRIVGTVRDVEQLFPGKKIVVFSGSSLGKNLGFPPNVAVIEGSLDSNPDAWEMAKDADYVICGYDPVRKNASWFRDNCDVMAFDECVRLKGKDSKIAQAAQEAFKKTPYLWYMSATPIPNAPMDLYVLMRGLNEKVFGTLSAFKKQHCKTEPNKWTGGQDIKGYVDVGMTHSHVSHMVYHRNYESPDVIVDMPKRNYEKTVCDMPDDLLEVYNAAAQAILQKALDAGASKFNPSNALSEILRLEQICLTPRLLSPSYSGSEPKLERAAQIAKDHFDEQAVAGKKPPKGIIFFSHYLETQPYLKEHLSEQAGLTESEIATIQGSSYKIGGKSVKTIQEVVDAMNQGHVKALIASDAAMEGLNLQYGATRLVHLDTPWRPDALEQREGRIYRPGQTEVCNFNHLLLHSPIEMYKDAVVQKKASDQSAIVEGADVETTSHSISYQDFVKLLSETLSGGKFYQKKKKSADYKGNAYDMIMAQQEASDTASGAF